MLWYSDMMQRCIAWVYFKENSLWTVIASSIVHLAASVKSTDCWYAIPNVAFGKQTDIRNVAGAKPVSTRTCKDAHLNMAANIEQIFQDFILNKIREVEDQNEDKAYVTVAFFSRLNDN